MKHTLYKQVIYSKNNKSSSSNSLTTRPTTIKSIFCIRKRSLIVVSQGVVSVLNLFCSVAHQRYYLYLFCRSNQKRVICYVSVLSFKSKWVICYVSVLSFTKAVLSFKSKRSICYVSVLSSPINVTICSVVANQR